jgi:hypothetical protein
MGKEKANKKLLIISCSQRKKKLRGKVKAWDLYDGVIFRMLKKIEREQGLPKNLKIIILSAKYGVINPSDYITFYDYRLNPKSNRHSFLSRLRKNIKDDNISHVFICLGKDYLKAIDGFENLFPAKTKLLYANGGIGLKMSYLKNWVYCSKVL